MSTSAQALLAKNFWDASEKLRVAQESIRASQQKEDKLVKLAADCQERLGAAQRNYAQMNRHADAAFRARNTRKGHQKAARRSEYAAIAVAAHGELRELERRLDTVRVALLEKEAARTAILAERRLHRHYWMKSIAENEPPERVQEYARLARVPERYCKDPSKIWYYTVQNGASAVVAVHLFWGGELSPTRSGWSPDGRGHGHAVLKLSGGKLRLAYMREVRRPKRRQSAARNELQITA